MNKKYLGDAVFVEVSDIGILISTANGIVNTNQIYLEDVYMVIALRDYLNDYIAERAEA